MVFTINGTDYSGHVLAGTYSVNSAPVTADWTDANGVVHKQKIRDKVSGTFDMWFRTLTEYNAFLSVLETNTTSALKVPLTVSVNNKNTDHTGNFYVSHAPVRNRDGFWDDYMERFTLTIEEA